MGAGARYPAATARGCLGKVNVGAHYLRGLPDSCQPVWRAILMIPGSIRVPLHLYRCLRLQTGPQRFLERKMEDVMQMSYTERYKRPSVTSDRCVTHYEISSGSTPV